MDVPVPPDLEEWLCELSSQTGRSAQEQAHFDALANSRRMLDGRYDEIESGLVKLVSGDEVFAKLRAKSAARRLQLKR